MSRRWWRSTGPSSQKPAHLHLNEPSSALSLKLADQVAEINETAIMMEEQNAKKSFYINDRGSVLEMEKILYEGPERPIFRDCKSEATTSKPFSCIKT
jgi:ABC-type branched-subunit amino acid transport system ATPase component